MLRRLLAAIVGIMGCHFFVFTPIKARSLALFYIQANLDFKASLPSLMQASKIEECNTSILDQLGKNALMGGVPGVAIYAYGKAMQCEPRQASFRVRYGEALVAYGFYETFAFKEAVALEPNNPVYLFELERVTKLREQSQ